MQGTNIVYPFYIPGTLAANLDIRFQAPFDMHFRQVSAVSSNDSDATLAIGISSDTDSILAPAAIGDSQVPVEKTPVDFASTNPTGQIRKGDIVVVTLDYDGSAGTPAANVTIVLTCTEG